MVVILTKLGNTGHVVVGLRRKKVMNSVWDLLIVTDVFRLSTDHVR